MNRLLSLFAIAIICFALSACAKSTSGEMVMDITADTNPGGTIEILPEQQPASEIEIDDTALPMQPDVEIVHGYTAEFRSIDDKDYFTTGSLTMDFDGNGLEEELIISMLPDNSAVTLAIGEYTQDFELDGADKISVHVADFNTSDGYKDVYIVCENPDGGYNVPVYRFDGYELSEYALLKMSEPAFTYDKAGLVYYSGSKADCVYYYIDNRVAAKAF